MSIETQGKKEVVEAVVIAALGAVATGLINWALEAAKARAQAKREAALAEGTEGA